MSDISKAFKLAREIIDAIVDGRLEAKEAKNLTDEQLAELIPELYAEYAATREERERLLAESEPE